MRIKLWGVRGSLPSPHSPKEIESRIIAALQDFHAAGGRDTSEIRSFLQTSPPGRYAGFGGNTPCIEVRTASTQVIVDGGTGIRALGRELQAGDCGAGRGTVHLLMTHFHWDHLMGLPFFTPLFIPGNEIHIYAVQEDLPQAIRTVFQKPFFPVPFEQLEATIHFHNLKPRQTFRIGDLEITPYQLDHPDPCWGYRFENEGKAFAHCVDSETTRFTREELGADLPLYQNLDLMIFDAQYTLMESILKEKWGHGSALVGIDLAMREKIRKVIFMHHDPAASDTKIQMIHNETRKYYEGQLRQSQRSGAEKVKVEWAFAQEEMTIEL